MASIGHWSNRRMIALIIAICIFVIFGMIVLYSKNYSQPIIDYPFKQHHGIRIQFANSSKYSLPILPMNASNKTNVTITNQCCGWGHRLHYHALTYQEVVTHNMAMIIHWPTFHEQCYSNKVGDNYTVHDLFDEIFDFQKVGVDTNVSIKRGQILQIDHLSEYQPHSWTDYQKLFDANIIDQTSRRILSKNEISSIQTVDIWDENIVKSNMTKKFYLQIAENLRPQIKAETSSFLSSFMNDDDTSLMTIHVRQGNGETGGFAERRYNSVDTFVNVINAQINELLNMTQSGKEWKIFVASDNELIIDGLRNVSKYEIVSREQQRAEQGAGVLHGEYGNDRPSGDCIGIAWDAWIDMLALSQGEILLIPAYSSFNYLPQIMVAENDGIVCGIFNHLWRCRTGNQMFMTHDELNEKLSKM